jgi:hypothetical protein
MRQVCKLHKSWEVQKTPMNACILNNALWSAKVNWVERWLIESSTKLQLSLIDQLEFNACSLQKVHKLVAMMLACELLLELPMFLFSETSQRCPWNVSKPIKHFEYECPSRNFGLEWDILVRGHSNLAWMMKEIH